jgi:hypothetical protein
MVAQSLQTKIRSLDWSCIDADTQYLTHSIHRYSGKFIPQIARQGIETITSEEDLVLDYYCGSGTTLLESNLARRYSIGIDLNPLAVLISRVKTTPLRKNVLLNFIECFKLDLNVLTTEDNQRTIFDAQRDETIETAKADWRWTDPWYRKWFGKDVLLELIAIYSRIKDESDQACRNLALVAFSDILRKSSNAHSGYPNVMFDRSKETSPPAIPRFIQRLHKIGDAVLTLNSTFSKQHKPVVIRANARSLPLQAESVDAIVTHPPYVGSIPYAEYGSLSLKWLGYDPKDLDSALTGGKRQSRNVLENFRQGYAETLRESVRVLKRGRMLMVLVGHPTVKGERIDLGVMTKQLAKEAGFKLAAEYTRSGTNRRANLMGDEDLIVFAKK